MPSSSDAVARLVWIQVLARIAVGETKTTKIVCLLSVKGIIVTVTVYVVLVEGGFGGILWR